MILFLLLIFQLNTPTIAIAYTVVIRRNSIYFIKFNKLINIIRQACNVENLERKLRIFYKYKLLVIDEVTFNEIFSLETKLFFTD